MLKRLETLLKTGFFHIFGASVVNKIVTFLSAIVLVRIISKDEYGVFSYAWNIYSFILLLSGLGITSGVLQLCSEKYADTHIQIKIYQFGLRFGTLVNIGLAIVIVICSIFIPLRISGSNAVLLYLCFLPLLSLWQDLQLVFIRCKRQNKIYAYLSTISTVIYAAFTIIGAYSYEVKGLIVGRYISGLCFLFVSICIFKTPFFEKTEHYIEKKEVNDILKISLISMLNNGLSQILYLADVFVIGLVLAESVEVASYKVATQIPNALSFIPVAAVTYVYPYFAEHKNDKAWCMKKYMQLVGYFGLLNLLISTFLIIFAPLIVSILFDAQYLDAVPAFRILSLSYFFSGTFRVISGNLLVTQRKLRFNTFVAVLSGIVNVVADYLFISLWGSIGAALATILVVILSSVLSTFYLLKIFKEK